MKARPFAALAALLAVGMIGSAARADDKAVRKALEAEYAKYTQAFRKKDYKTIMAMATPNITYKGLDGKTLNRQQIEAEFKNMMGRAKSFSDVSVKIGKVAVKGNEAVVTVSEKVSGTLMGEDGKTHKMVSEETTRDFWIKTAKGWKIKHVEAVKENMTVDGRPFNPAGPPPRR